MPSLSRTVSIMLLGLGSALAGAGDLTRSLGEVEIDARSPMKIPGLRDEALRAVFYAAGRTAGQSCGVVGARDGVSKSASILPILEPEPGQDWPSCDGISGGAVFRWRGNTGYVIRYRQRDTREDTSTGDFFAMAAASGPQAWDALNREPQPAKKSLAEVASWAKSRLAGSEAEAAGFRLSRADSIATAALFLNVSRNPDSGACRVDIDFSAFDSKFAAVTRACRSILATTALERSGTTSFIVMTQDADGHAQAQVFVAGKEGVREARDLEQQLQPEIASGKILAVKKALQRRMAR